MVTSRVVDVLIVFPSGVVNAVLSSEHPDIPIASAPATTMAPRYPPTPRVRPLPCGLCFPPDTQINLAPPRGRLWWQTVEVCVTSLQGLELTARHVVSAAQFGH